MTPCELCGRRMNSHNQVGVCSRPSCLAEHLRRFRVVKRVKLAEQQRTKYRVNRAKILRRNHAYRLANPEKIARRRVAYKAENTERFKKRAAVNARVVVSYYEHPRLAGLYSGWTKRNCTVMKVLHLQNKRGAERADAPEVLLMNGPSLVRNS